MALATGYINRYVAGKPRKQIIAVLTEEWTVLVFDYRAKLMWESSVHPGGIMSPRHPLPSTHPQQRCHPMLGARGLQKSPDGSLAAGESKLLCAAMCACAYLKLSPPPTPLPSLPSLHLSLTSGAISEHSTEPMFFHEASILISAAQIMKGDLGSVIIG